MATYARGAIITLTRSFLGPTGDPIVPVDDAYPQIQIEDPAGAIVASGVGRSTGTPGLWQFEWTVPADATISNEWQLTWTIVDLQLDSKVHEEVFSVVAAVETLQGIDRTATYLTMKDTTERLIWKGLTNPDDILLRFEGADQTVIFNNLTKNQINMVEADCLFNFYLDTPTLTNEGDYLITWRFRTTPTSQWEYHIQWLIVPFREFWWNLPHLRMLVDKLNKVTTTPLSYLDSELHKSFEQGLGLLNSVHPFTNWTWNNVPRTFHTWWIMCAGLWTLNSRQLLEIEVQHSASGQTVTLEYDHVGPLSEVMSRWQEMIRDWMMPAKLAAFRQSAGPGMVAVRPARLQYQNRVYRIAESTQALQDFPALLNRLGIFY